jgi:pilus assembly protein Flp/PilA
MTPRARPLPPAAPAALRTRFAADERGAAGIEYGLIASLVAVALVVSLLSLGVQLSDTLDMVGDEVAPAPTAPDGGHP